MIIIFPHIFAYYEVETPFHHINFINFAALYIYTAKTGFLKYKSYTRFTPAVEVEGRISSTPHKL